MIELMYFSRTNHTRKFMYEHLHYPRDLINDIEVKTVTDKPYILFTPTYDFGEIPEETKKFLSVKENQNNLKGVVSFGNRNWGNKFANAGMLIMKEYEVPLLAMIEMAGNKQIAESLVNKIHTQYNN